MYRQVGLGAGAGDHQQAVQALHRGGLGVQLVSLVVSPVQPERGEGRDGETDPGHRT